VPARARSIMALSVSAAVFTDGIEVCAVTIMGHALYKDIRLSGNRVRGCRGRD